MKLSGPAVPVTAQMSRLLAEVRQVYRSGDLRHAERLCSDAIASHGDWPEVINLLAQIFLKTKRQQQALQLAQRCVDMQPGVAVFHDTLAAALTAIGQHTEALKEIDRCVELCPRYGSTHALRGRILDRLGRHQEAADAYQRALAYPDTTDAALIYTRLGTARMKSGDLQAAEAAFRQALAVDNDFADARSGLMQLGHRPETSRTHVNT
jgi:tetratricopeptide (TPR) repeat protein